MNIKRVFSGAPWEVKAGYCRAIQVGQNIYISGTTPIDETGQVFAPNNAYAQAKRCLEIIEKALQELGTDIRSVIRTRMFVTDISQWAEYGKAHQEFFSEHPPATSMVEVSKLIDPAMLIEIEAEAIFQNF
ncbi:MAG: RidA family protein [Spirulinaceae cyanobacterium]